MNKKLSSMLSVIQSEAKSIACKVEGNYLSTKDTVINTVDDGIGIVKKTYETVTGALEAFVTVGVSVALVVAPVPTAVALAIMFIMSSSIKEKKDQINSDIESRKKNRDFGRAVTLLKKYGRVPANATTETDYLRLEINAACNKVTGTILQGEHKGARLEDLPDSTILTLLEKTPDKPTGELLKAYLSFSSNTSKTDAE